MNKIIGCLCLLLFFAFAAETSHAQVFKRNKGEVKQKNEIETPAKRNKSRKKEDSEAKVKVKKNQNYIKKKSNNVEYKVKVSRKSNETTVPIENQQLLTDKKKKPLRVLRKTKKNSEKVSSSQGNVRIKKTDTKDANVDEKVTQRVKKKSLKKQRRETQKQEQKLAESKGPVEKKGRLKREDKGSVTDEKVTQRIKVKSEKRRRKELEKQEQRIAHSNGPVIIKTKSEKRRKKEIEKEERRIAASNGPVAVKQDKEKIAKRSHEQATYQGNMTLIKRTKEMHPTVKYIDGKKLKSAEDKEKLRKKELRKSRTRNAGQPDAVKNKKKKLKYDTRESEIWYE